MVSYRRLSIIAPRSERCRLNAVPESPSETAQPALSTIAELSMPAARRPTRFTTPVFEARMVMKTRVAPTIPYKTLMAWCRRSQVFRLIEWTVFARPFVNEAYSPGAYRAGVTRVEYREGHRFSAASLSAGQPLPGVFLPLSPQPRQRGNTVEMPSAKQRRRSRAALAGMIQACCHMLPGVTHVILKMLHLSQLTRHRRDACLFLLFSEPQPFR